jgi:hypothetical protein
MTEEYYVPWGWPAPEVLTAVLNGVDTSWDFTLVTRVLPPARILREMYGQWRKPTKEVGPVTEPYTWIPQRVIDETPVKDLDTLLPDREWCCELRAYAFTVEGTTRVAFATKRFMDERSPNLVFRATYDSAQGEQGLLQALTQFSNGCGVGP